MNAATFSTEVGLAEIGDDFVRMTTRIGWCTVATVDHRGRPRARILHVSWEIVDGCPVGWVSTARTPVKTAHLAGNPYVSCSYWTPEHDAVFADCRASWVEDAPTTVHVWELVAVEAAQRGFDALAIWPLGPADPGFQVLRLDPWRVQITRPDLAQGRTIDSSLVWHAPDPAGSGGSNGSTASAGGDHR